MNAFLAIIILCQLFNRIPKSILI